MPMNHDAPEREVLNLMEMITIYQVQRRLLDRQFVKATEAMRRFAKVMAEHFPMDDWDDEVIEEIARG